MSDAKSLFTVIIEALDKFSAPIDHMAQRAHAFGAPLREIGDRFEHLNHTSGLERIVESFGRVRESIAGAAEKLTEFVGPLAALGAVGSLAGLGELVMHTAEVGEQLSDMAKTIGVTVEQLQELHNAARMTGTPLEAMDKAMEMLNRRLGDAARGKNPDVLALFAKMGGIKDASGHLMNAAQVLPRIADLLVKNQSAATRAAIMTALFGKAGQELTPMLIEGSAALAKYAEQQRQAGELTGEQAEAAGHFNQTYKRMKLSVTSLTEQIGARLIPTIEPLLTRLTTWIDAHRTLIATKLEHMVKQLADAIKSVDWERFLTGLEHAIDKVGSFARDTLGLKGTLILVAGVIAGPLIGAIAGIGTAFIGLAAALIANPIGAAIAVVVAGLIVGTVEIIKHWSQVKEFFRNLWENNALFRVAVILSPIGELVRAGKWLADNWESVSKRIVWSVNAIAEAYKAVNFVPRMAYKGFTAIANKERELTGIPNLLDLGGGQNRAPAGPAQLVVTHENAPRGMRVNTVSLGPFAEIQNNVGYSMRGFSP